MDAVDFESMTDYDIRDLQELINVEKNRRKREIKLSVYYFNGQTMKSLPDALKKLKSSIETALNYPGGPEKYFIASIENEIKTDLISLKIEFWSKTEYDARPDTVWGYE